MRDYLLIFIAFIILGVASIGIYLGYQELEARNQNREEIESRFDREAFIQTNYNPLIAPFYESLDNSTVNNNQQTNYTRINAQIKSLEFNQECPLFDRFLNGITENSILRFDKYNNFEENNTIISDKKTLQDSNGQFINYKLEGNTENIYYMGGDYAAISNTKARATTQIDFLEMILFDSFLTELESQPTPRFTNGKFEMTVDLALNCEIDEYTRDADNINEPKDNNFEAVVIFDPETYQIETYEIKGDEGSLSFSINAELSSTPFESISPIFDYDLEYELINLEDTNIVDIDIDSLTRKFFQEINRDVIATPSSTVISPYINFSGQEFFLDRDFYGQENTGKSTYNLITNVNLDNRFISLIIDQNFRLNNYYDSSDLPIEEKIINTLPPSPNENYDEFEIRQKTNNLSLTVNDTTLNLEVYEMYNPNQDKILEAGYAEFDEQELLITIFGIDNQLSTSLDEISDELFITNTSDSAFLDLVQTEINR